MGQARETPLHGMPVLESLRMAFCLRMVRVPVVFGRG